MAINNLYFSIFTIKFNNNYEKAFYRFDFLRYR